MVHLVLSDPSLFFCGLRYCRTVDYSTFYIACSRVLGAAGLESTTNKLYQQDTWMATEAEPILGRYGGYTPATMNALVAFKTELTWRR